MATKQELVQFLVKECNAEVKNESVLTVQVSWDDGRSHTVFIAVSDAFIALRAAFALKDSVNLDKVLALTQDSLLGVGSSGEGLVLKHMIPSGDIDASEIHIGLNYIAEQADDLEKALLGKDIF